MSLLNSSSVEDGASLENLEAVLAGVADGGLDLGVANHLELDLERSRGTLLGGSGHGQGGEGDEGQELHGEGRRGVLIRILQENADDGLEMQVILTADRGLLL